MNKRINSIILTITLLLIYSISLQAQMNNPKAFEGTWEGSWLNTTYQSTGLIVLTVTVEETQQKMFGHWDVGGTVLGMPSIDEFDTELPFKQEYDF